MRISRNKKIPQRIVAGLLLVSIVLMGLFYGSRKTEAGWYDDNWAYRRTINITGHTTSENNVYLNLTGGSALDSQGASKTNCGDIRFTDVNGKVLPYYIVSGCKTASTVVHVFFETFPAGAQTIYYYYGNPSAHDGFSSTPFSTPASGVTFGSYGSQEVGPGPAVYWTFDEGYGTNINSNTQTGPSMTLNAGTGTPWTTEERCVSGKCLHFNATGAVTANSSIADIKTVQFWVRPNSNTATLIDFSAGAQTTIWVSATNGVISSNGITSPTYYINGIQTNTPTLTAHVWQHIAITTNTAMTGTAIMLGEMPGAPTFSGFLDEVKLYRTVRTNSEVRADAVRWATSEGSSVVLGGQDTKTVGPHSSGLVGYWNTDENSSPSIDRSGNGINGVWTNSPTTVAGKFGRAIDLNGTNQYISMGDQTVHDLTLPFTVSAWIYMDQLPSTKGTDAEIVSKYATTANRQWTFAVGTDNKLYFWKSHNGTDGEFLITNGHTFSASDVGKWRHVSLSADTSGKAALFVDGVQVDSYTLANTQFFTGASADLLVGARGDLSRFFDGKIDEVRIYNRTLHFLEQKQLSAWTPGPVGHWKMDENRGATAFDTSGNDRALSISGAHNWVSGKAGSAFAFPGDDGVYADTTTSLPGSHTFTLAFWVKTTSTATTGVLIDWGGRLCRLGGVSANKISCTVDGGIAGSATSITNVNNGRWNHIAISSTSNGQKLYVNGALEATATEALITSDSVVRIGRSSASSFPFSGIVDDIRIYNFERSQAQISEDFGVTREHSAFSYWKFDEGYGDTVYDSGSSLTHGTRTATSWVQGGVQGKALRFNGVNSQVNLGSVDFFGGNPEGSVCTWLRYGLPDVSSDGIILSNFNNTTNGWTFFVDDSAVQSGRTNTIAFVADPNSVGGRVEGSTNLVAPGRWDHYCAVFMGSQYIKLYKNGKIDQQQTVSVPATFSTGASYTTYLGRSMAGSYLSGELDNTKIFKQALSDEQVAIEYNLGTSTQLGFISTDADGKTATNSAGREYCIPGDTSLCRPPVGHWRLDEQSITGSLNEVKDVSGNEIHGQSKCYFGGQCKLPRQTIGKTGNGTAFLVDDNFPVVDMGASTLLNPGAESFTLSFWGKINAVVDQNFTHYVGKWGDTVTDSVYEITSGYAIIIHNSTSYQLAYSPIHDNTWHHISMVVNRQAQTMTVYRDGILDAQTSISGLGSTALNPNYEFLIGGVLHGGSSFDGVIDDVRYYNYARTTAQVAWDYNRGAPTHRYKFNECQGSTLYNSAATANGKASGINGVISLTGNDVGTCESPTSTDVWNIGKNGKYGSAFGLDGNDFATVASPALPTADFTYTAWINLDTINANRPVLKATDGAGGNELTLEVMASGGGNPKKLHFAADGTSIYSSQSIDVGAWYHVVGRRTNGLMEVFINGQKDTSTGSDATSLNFSTCGLYIGAGPTSSCGGGITTYFDGLIDDVHIYNYSLTDAQIKVSMNEGSAVRFGP